LGQGHEVKNHRGSAIHGADHERASCECDPEPIHVQEHNADEDHEDRAMNGAEHERASSEHDPEPIHVQEHNADGDHEVQDHEDKAMGGAEHERARMPDPVQKTDVVVW